MRILQTSGYLPKQVQFRAMYLINIIQGKNEIRNYYFISIFCVIIIISLILLDFNIFASRFEFFPSI